MKRPKEIDDALAYIAQISPENFDTIYEYIRTLELMINTAYHTLDKLDELV